ncbi:hypothetical protein G3469_12055 [Shewanella baltica]|nr:hypothetical protein [Shewanella baltica]
MLEYFVVEAKGPGAKLSTGASKGDQMTDRWVKNNLQAMEESKNNEHKKELGSALLKTKRKKIKVTKLVIEAVEVDGTIIGGKIQPLPLEVN